LPPVSEATFNSFRVLVFDKAKENIYAEFLGAVGRLRAGGDADVTLMREALTVRTSLFVSLSLSGVARIVSE